MLEAKVLTTAEQVSMAERTLHSYSQIYGQEIYRLTSEEAWAKARKLREDSKTKEVPESLTLLSQSVQFQAIAQCLKTLGEQPRYER